MTTEEKREMEILKGDIKTLVKTITTLNRRIGGYRTSNENYKKAVRHYKELCDEADGLYEGKIAECDELKKRLEEALCVRNDAVPMTKFAELQQSIETKNEFIEQLQGKVQGLIVEKKELESAVESQRHYIQYMEEELRDKLKPWWMRIF